MHTKTKGLQNVRESLYTGAVYGATAWIIYATVEYFFTVILPWIMNPSHDYTPVHPAFTVLLFVIYPLTGLILGGLSGLCLHAAARANLFSKKTNASMFAPFATLTVVLAFDVNLLYIWLSDYFPAFKILPSVGISLLLLPALLFSTAHPQWQRRLRFLTNPWTVALVLLGILPLVVYNPLYNSSMTVKSIAALLYPAAIFMISFFVYKIQYIRRTDKSSKIMSASPLRTLAFVVPVYVLLFGTGLFLKQTPIQTAQPQASSLQESDKPNIILITMDTVRADNLSLYGYERDTTPNLKKLSEESVLYRNSISTSNMTLPSHASIFTGRYTRSHGAHHFFTTLTPSDDELAWIAKHSQVQSLSDKFNTLTEILSEKGYLTMAVVANGGYLGAHYNINQGFQFYDYRAPVPFLGLFLGKVRPFYLRQTIHTLSSHIISTPDHYKVSRNAEEINNEVFTLLDKVKKDDAKFFMFINYLDAHWPYSPPPPFDTLFPGKDETFNTALKFAEVEREVIMLERKLTDKERQHIVSQYDGGIAYEDFYIGKLIARLKKAGMFENTLIIITSDHGETFGRRNFMQHGNSVYQNEVKVPLLIKYPNSNQKTVVEKYVSGVDLMPTVLDVLGYEIPGDIQGVSLLKPEGLNNRNIISESFGARRNLRYHKRFYRIQRAIFSDSMKFITSTSGTQELYDLSKDPEEKKNIYRSDDSTSEKLKAELNQWFKDVSEDIPSRNGSAPRKKSDKGALDRLKALGYIQ